MKYLVTGGAGFIGVNLALSLENLGNEVTILDDFSVGTKENLKDFNGNFIHMNILSKNLLNIEGNFDAIFHEAAITDPRYPNDREVLNVNINGFCNILKLTQKKHSKLIYASSASIYGNGPTPMQEDQHKDLTSAYSMSKFLIDEICGQSSTKMDIIGLRYFNVFGPRESHKGKSASMIYHLINQIKKKQNPQLFKYGEQKRDHIYIKDVVQANILALKAPSGTYNIGTGTSTSFNEIIGVLNSILRINSRVEYISNPYSQTCYQNNTQADTKKAENILKFKAKYSLREGVSDYLKSVNFS